MYFSITKTFNTKNKIKVDFERKNQYFPEPLMNTLSQTSNCLQVFAGKSYTLIFGTELFQKVYRRFKTDFSWNSTFEGYLLPIFWILSITFDTCRAFAEGRSLRSLLNIFEEKPRGF